MTADFRFGGACRAVVAAAVYHAALAVLFQVSRAG